MQHSRSSKSEILYKSPETAMSEILTDTLETQLSPHEGGAPTEGSSGNDRSQNEQTSLDGQNDTSGDDVMLVLDCATSTDYLNLSGGDQKQCEEETMDATDDDSKDETSFVDLAYMNVNTNGKSRGDCMHELLEPSAKLRNNACLTKVKHINIGQVPLKPVGLSLSGSGMQLFVKVNSEQKKRLLENVNVKCTDKMTRPRRKRETNGKTNVLSCTTQTADMPFPLHIHKAQKIPQPDSPTLTHGDRTAHPLESAQEAPPNRAKKMRSWRDQSNQQDNRQVVEKDFSKAIRGSLPRYEETHCPSNTYQRAHKRVRSNSPACEHRHDSVKAGTPGQLVFESIHGDRTHSLISGPSWKFRNGKIDVSNAATTRKSFNKVRSESQDVICLDDDRCVGSYVFTSGDLISKPTHHFTAEPKGSQEHQRQRSQREGHPGEHRFLPSHTCQQDSPTPSLGGSPSDSDDECDNGYNRFNRLDEKKKTRTTVHGRDNNAHNAAHGVQHTLEHVRVKTEPSDPQSLSRMFDKATSSTSITDHGSFSSVALDEATLAKFTEYTTNMRKDLRQNFKNLSQLMKEFNHEVLERNNNRSSQSTSTVGSETNDRGPAKSRSTCSLM